jgi:hypothetical protein
MNRDLISPEFIFSALMRLFPPAFRDEFGEEMAGVFAEKMGEERKAGLARRISIVFYELADLTIQALAERAEGRYGKEHPMSDNLHRVRIFAVLSPVILAVFLVIINPRYVLRLFSDPMGWAVVAAVLLGLGIGLILWSAPMPTQNGRKLVQEFALVFILLLLDVLIILGPAIVMVFGSSSQIAAGREFSAPVMWFLLAVNGVLACVVIGMAINRMQAKRSQTK